MKNVTIYLSEKHEKMIDEMLDLKFYDSNSEIVREALELLREKHLLRYIKREELRQEIQKGIDQMREGKYKSYKSENLHEFFDEIIERGMEELKAKEGLKP